MAAYGPASLPVDRDLLRLWVRRGLLVYLPAPVLYLVALRIQDVPAPPGMWVIGMLTILVTAVVATLMYPEGAE